MKNLKSMAWFQEELKLKAELEQSAFGDVGEPLKANDSLNAVINDNYLHELMMNDHVDETINESK